MAATATEMSNSFMFVIDLKVDVEGDKILFISFMEYFDDGAWRWKWIKKFDLPRNANLDAISAVSQNGSLIVTINKAIYQLTTPRTIKVSKTDVEE
ncbi:hypothetical protein MKX03_014470 [Papaver bracteatum]|nr:hypothetical protein MKX03_014470 [Papaver bracteatum]